MVLYFIQIYIMSLCYQKKCTKCGNVKDGSAFCKQSSRPDGLYCWCKECQRLSRAQYAMAHKEQELANGRKYYNKHKPQMAEKAHKYRQTKKGRAAVNASTMRYYYRHRAERLAAGKKRRSTDLFKKKMRERMRLWRAIPINRLSKALRSRLRHALNGALKSATTESLLGCSFEKARAYIESQFQPGMGWENYGQWHVDHIIPCKFFDLSLPEHQQLCFNFRNLQPLWAADNLTKWAKITVDNLAEHIENLKRQVHDNK